MPKLDEVQPHGYYSRQTRAERSASNKPYRLTSVEYEAMMNRAFIRRVKDLASHSRTHGHAIKLLGSLTTVCTTLTCALEARQAGGLSAGPSTHHLPGDANSRDDQEPA